MASLEPHWIPQCIEHLRQEAKVQPKVVAEAGGWKSASTYSAFVCGRKMHVPVLWRVDAMLALLGKKLAIVDMDASENAKPEVRVDMVLSLNREIASAERVLRELHGRKASL